jgi:hypothetical protein
VFVEVAWPNGYTQRGSIAFEMPLAAKVASVRPERTEP